MMGRTAAGGGGPALGLRVSLVCVFGKEEVDNTDRDPGFVCNRLLSWASFWLPWASN